MIFICTWSELADLKARGMIILAVHQLEGAETWIEADFPEELMNEMTKQAESGKRKHIRLGTILEQLLRAAMAATGQVQRVTLPGGMGVDMIVGLDGKTRLQIWREGKYPSEIEWRTTLRHWPYQVEAEIKKRFTHQEKYYFQSEWETAKPGDEFFRAAMQAGAEAEGLPEGFGESRSG